MSPPPKTFTELIDRLLQCAVYQQTNLKILRS